MCNTLYNEDTGDDVAVTSMRSSDPSVAAIVTQYDAYCLKALSPGTVTITGEYRASNGSLESLSLQVRVKAIPAVFRNLKVCGKKVNLSNHQFGLNKKVNKTTGEKFDYMVQFYRKIAFAK